MAPPSYPLILNLLSLSLAIGGLALAAVIIQSSPIFWIVIISSLLTIAHNCTVAFAFAPNRSPAPLSPFFWTTSLASSYTLTIVWVASTIIQLVSIVLRVQKPDNSGPILFELWKSVLTCIISLWEAGTMAFIAVWTHKTRSQLLYTAKWKWRITLNNPQWSISPNSSNVQSVNQGLG